MDRGTELELIDELLALKSENTHYLDHAVAQNSVTHYTCPDRFARETTHIFEASPVIAAHSSELAGAGAFLRREIAGRSVLLTRDKTGTAHAFLNACRHRGTRLVDDESGCKHRFSCPYHAWTYSNTGDLLAAPHLDSGFPNIDKSDLGLATLPCVERFGFLWVAPTPRAEIAIEASLAGLSDELTALGLDQLCVAHQDVSIRKANWKILIEGGIEAYHFKVAHRTTIGPHFEDNLSSYRVFGPHMRSILPRTSMARLDPATRDTWRLRDHAQVLYNLFPSTSLLVQQDHVAWIQQEPLAADQTRIRISTLVPKSEIDNSERWQRNHTITMTTLEEDFVIGESIQSTLDSGANETLLFGRFEGALEAFNQTVNRYVDA